MNRAKINKYAMELEVENKVSSEFRFSWVGERIPEFITFPSSMKKKVISMRDNLIIFDDKSTSLYRRTFDDNKTQERVIVITYSE